jgi:cytochrome c oxidase assembly protein subunit 15
MGMGDQWAGMVVGIVQNVPGRYNFGETGGWRDLENREAKMNRFQKWALSTTIATYLLIFVGGLVRAAGAGLGCPDWPRCFGLWIPPTRASQLPAGYDPAQFVAHLTWLEYVNRLIGATIGLLMIATLVVAVRDHRSVKRILWPTFGACGLIFFNAWLGKVVVESELNPLTVTTHLVTALAAVSLLMYATISAFFPQGHRLSRLPAERRRLSFFTLGVIFFSMVQVAFGTVVRGRLDLIEGQFPGLARDQWIEHIGAMDQVHRSFSLWVFALILALTWYVFRRLSPNRWLRLNTSVIAGLTLVQMVAGVGLAYLALPPVLRVTHLWVGSLLLGAETLLFLLARRLPDRAMSSPSIPTALRVEQKPGFSKKPGF